jgi:hypothetical protein
MKRMDKNLVSRRRFSRMTGSTVFRWTLSAIAACVLFGATAIAHEQLDAARRVAVNKASAAARPPAIVIGFLGGFVGRNNLVHSEVQLAARLRKEYPTGVDVVTFESRHEEEARRAILELLDAEHSGNPSAEEKQNAKIIIYGHSWGGSASILLARKLEQVGIPVLLTVQVDSVAKLGQNDTTIPPNVAQAANFYQPHGLVHGDHDIRAVDPSRTKIVGNFRFDYGDSPLKCSQYPWWDRYFVKAHTQIECDPVVWNRVHDLIRSNLPAVTPTVAAR